MSWKSGAEASAVFTVGERQLGSSSSTMARATQGAMRNSEGGLIGWTVDVGFVVSQHLGFGPVQGTDWYRYLREALAIEVPQHGIETATGPVVCSILWMTFELG